MMCSKDRRTATRREIESPLRRDICELCAKRDQIRMSVDSQEKAIQELEMKTPSLETEDTLAAYRRGLEMKISQLEEATRDIKILEGHLQLEQGYMDRNW